MKYLILIICLFISALCFNSIIYPNHIVSGGIPGIVVIITKYLKISPSILTLILSTILFIFSYLLLDKKKTFTSVISTIIYPLFIKLTSNNLIIPINNMIVLSIIIGLITGINLGIIYKIGFNNGGISTIVSILFKYTKLSIPIISLTINVLIILIGWITIGNHMIIYSTLILVINSLIIKIIIKNRN